MIRRLVFLHLMGLSGVVALASDGFSGSIDAGVTDPKGKGPYQRVMTPKVKVRPDSICRFSVEANVDAPGKLTFGPNCWVKGKPRDDAGLSNCWPDGNLVRRCAIDLAGGSLGSVSLTARQLQRADPAHMGYANVGAISTLGCPNGRFVAANAFARLLGGATFVAKPSVRRGVNAFLFRDRHGRDVVLAWEREAGRPCEDIRKDIL